MTMNKNIQMVLVNACKHLKHSKNLLEGIINNDYFVTVVESQTYKILVNGTNMPKEKIQYTIIDATNKMIVDDWNAFQNHSTKLYNLFKSISRWYNC